MMLQPGEKLRRARVDGDQLRVHRPLVSCCPCPLRTHLTPTPVWFWQIAKAGSCSTPMQQRFWQIAKSVAQIAAPYLQPTYKTKWGAKERPPFACSLYLPHLPYLFCKSKKN
jgi:hypothetical protein